MPPPLRRIRALVLRHIYCWCSSWPRLLDLDLLAHRADGHVGLHDPVPGAAVLFVAQAAGVLLSAVLLWDTLFRGHLGVSMAFLEEM